MGLVDKLLKMVGQRVGDTLSEKLTEVVSNMTGNSSENPVYSNGSSSVNPACSNRDSWDVYREKGRDVWQKLEETFAAHFSDYEVRKEVSPTEIGGTGRFIPYTYGLYLNGEAKAFIMVTEHNGDCKREFRWSKEQAQRSGIPFINFFSHMTNKDQYILERLSQYLKVCG